MSHLTDQEVRRLEFVAPGFRDFTLGQRMQAIEKGRVYLEKHLQTHGDWSAAALFETVDLWTPESDVKLKDAFIKLAEVAAGTSVTACTIELGISGGETDALMKAVDIFTGATLTYKGDAADVVRTVNMIDDDNAASTGTAVNIVESNSFAPLAHLESTLAGNANTDVDVEEGDDALPVTDNDSPGGVQLYFDEDGAAGEKFLFVSPSATDAVVPLRSGRLLPVMHDASAASNGVAVYCDDDAASADEKLMFVSPTDTDGSELTEGTLLGNPVKGNALADGSVIVPAGTAITLTVRTVGANVSVLTTGRIDAFIEYQELPDDYSTQVAG